MTNKKRKVKLASLLRKEYGIEFIESQELAKKIIRYGINEAMDLNGFEIKSKKPCRCGYCIHAEIIYLDEKHGIRFDPIQIEEMIKMMDTGGKNEQKN